MGCADFHEFGLPIPRMCLAFFSGEDIINQTMQDSGQLRQHKNGRNRLVWLHERIWDELSELKL